MPTLSKTKTIESLVHEIHRLQCQNSQLKADNHCSEIKSNKPNLARLPRTGWSEIDGLFEEADRLHQELRMIQSDCYDILYPSINNKQKGLTLLYE